MLSSASIPFVFPNRPWDDLDVICTDGGAAYNIDIVSAVQRCMEIVEDESQITIDIIMNNNAHFEKFEYKKDGF